MKVLLIDDHALFAHSLEIALSDYQIIDNFTTIQDIENVIDIIKSQNPDIILMDINLKNMNSEDGLSLTQNIISALPNQKILILTGYDLPVYQHEAKKVGAKGFVSKTVEPEELVHILMSIHQGSTFFPKVNIYIEELTDSEKEVLALLATGMKRKDMAKHLYLSERTISNHLQHIFDKLQVTSSVEAVTKGIQLGYISPL